MMEQISSEESFGECTSSAAPPFAVEEADEGGISIEVPTLRGNASGDVHGTSGCCRHIFVDLLINMRCSDRSIWVLSVLLGVVVLGSQTAPIFLLNWVLIREPRPLNITRLGGPVAGVDDQGPLEIPFEYNAGYFGMCRQRLPLNLSSAEGAIAAQVDQLVPILAPDMCVWNSIYTGGEEIGEFSVATNAVTVRLLIPTILHCSGSLLTAFGLLCSLVGHSEQSWKSVCAAILYVFGGLVVLVGVLQVICIVDDEMAPRMKPNAAGEPSAFSFHYGLSFLSAALSFLPMQLCVWLEITTFFRRFSSPLERTRVIPGLSELLSQLSLVRTSRTHQLGRPGGWVSGGLVGHHSTTGISVNFASRRRESRAASKDLGMLGEQILIRRSSSNSGHLLFV
ncbi:hypothetical protein niasHT_035463 [Heterodera trifolii]|uniref:Transmembrane protein n=1 Tax=Heterodera trifolii TaxID=157864 RepID=A0ABD2I5J7_9BILA